MKRLIKWNIPRGDTIIPQSLLDAGFSPLLSAMLYIRGYADVSSATAFLSGEDDCLGEVLLTDILPAIERIRLAAKNGETVAVFGDYDVDGITSTCLLTDYLIRYLGLTCIPYIPSRLSEGYGLNKTAISSLHARGVSLIITVDCGITAVEEAQFAKSLGVDMIITDHHECQQILPDACAVIDPKREENLGGWHNLAGVGVAFKLVCALHGDANIMLDTYADLIAIGTVADVMPLSGENRMMVRQGLMKINRSPRAGLLALLSATGTEASRVTSTTIGFTLSPRLNAAGRLGCALRAASLLMEEDPIKADKMAKALCDLNRQRQEMERDIWREAELALRGRREDEPIVLVSDTWHQGVVGIVASRLAEAYMVPTVMICFEGDKGKGSCRSYLGFNLFEALTACSDCLEGFGGHALAAGLTISAGSVDVFREKLTEYYRQNPPTAEAGIDFDLNISDPRLLTRDCVKSLAQLEPCGSANPRPRLCMQSALLTSLVHMGAGKHLRLSVEMGGKIFECVYFSHTQKELGIAVGDVIDIAFYPQINEYRGKTSVQLVLSDLRRHDTSAQCKSILLGKMPSHCNYSEHCPRRADFALVWRAMLSLDGRSSGNLSELIDGFSHIGLKPQKLCACMAVFDEIGLLNIAVSGDIINIQQTNTNEKRDLSTSRYYEEFIKRAGR